MTRQESSEIFELVFEASLLNLAWIAYQQDCRESIGGASRRVTAAMAGGFALIALALFYDMATDRYALLHGYEKLAKQRLDENDYEQAMHFLEKAREVRPDYVPVLIKLAGVHQVTGDEEGTEQILREVLETAPRQINVLTHLGHLYLDRGDLAAAEPLLLRAYAERPQRVDVLMGMGRLRFLQDRFDEAANLFRAVLHQDPNHAEAGRYLEQCLANSSGSDPVGG
jgi:Flp pilus assembly protein TadD